MSGKANARRRRVPDPATVVRLSFGLRSDFLAGSAGRESVRRYRADSLGG